MRLFFAIMCAVALVILWSPAFAQEDASAPKTGVKPDLPLEKPVPEETEEPPEEEKPEGETPPDEEIPEEPPEETIPENPPPEFFEEPVESAEVIFVIDRTGSMRWPSNMAVVDGEGNAINGAPKYEVAKIELTKTINNLAENVKFALVVYATGMGGGSRDTNWLSGTPAHPGGKWNAWPPAGGEPAPLGCHYSHPPLVVIWPSNKQLVKATAENKSTAVGWVSQRLSYAEVSGGTCTYDGMSPAIAMASVPPAGGGGSEGKKSPTAIYLLTDGAPTHIGATAYALCHPWGSYDAGELDNDGTWTQQCMDSTKAKILAENASKRARIYTLGIGMNMSHPNAYVWNPATSSWDFYATQYNDKCRQFLIQLAEATGGHYREVSQ